jgi:Domain of unknown function (DU1801)
MAENKTKATNVTVEAFLASVADASKRADALALIDMMQTASNEKPRMWGPSIIGFGSYHYHYESGREGDSPIVGFSPRKAALVIYIVTGFRGAEPLLAKLGKHSMGKSCLYVKRLADVDLPVLRKLIDHSVVAVRAKYKC